MSIAILCLNGLSTYVLFRLLVKIDFRNKLNHSQIAMISFYKNEHIIQRLKQRYIDELLIEENITFSEMLVFYIIYIALVILIVLMSGLNPFYQLNLSIMLIATPLIAIEIIRNHLIKKIERGLFQLLTQFNSRLMKKEDVISAMYEIERVIDNQPIRKILRRFNQSIQIGIQPEQAFQNTKRICINEYFRYIITNIEIVYKRRGNVTELMRALENEYTSIQVEVNKRKTELVHELRMILVSLMLVILVTIKVIKDNDYIVSFYSGHFGLIIIISLVVIMGIILVIKGYMKTY